MEPERGLVHIYYGDGQGKTSAAFGLALRCTGRGRQAVAAQFLKHRPSGEVLAAAHIPGLTVLRGAGPEKFTFQMDASEQCLAAREAGALLERAEALALRTGAGLLVLDEVLDACRTLLEPEAVTAVLDRRPPSMDVVLTGHILIPELAQRADYITRMVKERHPYDRGISAREGIEY